MLLFNRLVAFSIHFVKEKYVLEFNRSVNVHIICLCENYHFPYWFTYEKGTENLLCQAILTTNTSKIRKKSDQSELLERSSFTVLERNFYFIIIASILCIAAWTFCGLQHIEQSCHQSDLVDKIVVPTSNNIHDC